MATALRHFSSLVYDGAIDAFDPRKASAAFDWQISGRSNADIAPKQGLDGNRSLALEVNATFFLPVGLARARQAASEA